MTLTEADLAHKIADDSGFVKGGGGRDRDRLLEVIEASLVSSQVVMVSGFGEWSVKSKRPSTGTNAQIGEEIILDGRKVDTRKYGPVPNKAVSKVLLNHGSL